MGEREGAVPQTPWETAFWLCAAVIATLMTATASSAVELVLGILLALSVVPLFLWSRRIHMSQPALLQRRMPSELLWFLVLVAGFVLIAALAEPTVIDKVTVGLMAIGLFLLVIAERTRPIPMGDYEIKSTGGYFDPTTRIGLKRRGWASRGVWVVAIIVGVVVGLAGGSVGFFLAGIWLFGWLVFYEPLVWIVKRRKLGYFALHDEDAS